jgi:hypothetical protein
MAPFESPSTYDLVRSSRINVRLLWSLKMNQIPPTPTRGRNSGSGAAHESGYGPKAKKLGTLRWSADQGQTGRVPGANDYRGTFETCRRTRKCLLIRGPPEIIGATRMTHTGRFACRSKPLPTVEIEDI